MDTSQILSISNLTAGYPNKPVLDGLDIPGFQAGEVTVLTGPNAAGKSTLLKSIAGLLNARGNINLAADNIMSLSSGARAKLISFMPQHVPADVNLSVMEAVISALKASGFDAVNVHNKDVAETALSILRRVGIEHLALSSLNQLSGGQRQLASLARTVVRNPKVLLLDEPTSALDLRHQVKVMKLARSFAAEGRIVIMVLHDLNLALRWADKVVMMNRGKIAGIGKPTDAITTEIISEVYGVAIRVETCSRGMHHLIVDDEVER